MEVFKKLVAILSSEFDKYVLEHPEIGRKIPKNALLVFQMEGNEKFNKWGRELATKYQEKKQNIVFVHIKGLRPTISRLIEPRVEKAVIK